MKRLRSFIYLVIASSLILQGIAMTSATKAFAAEVAPDLIGDVGQANVAVADFKDSITEGAGFKFAKAGGDFVDFRLKDAPPEVPLTAGGITLFDLPDGGTAKYTTTQDRIKEEIILDKKPLTNEISFGWSSSNLVPIKSGDGGYLIYKGDTAAFKIEPLIVFDAKGKRAQASLAFTKDQAVVTVDSAFLENAAYRVTVENYEMLAYFTGVSAFAGTPQGVAEREGSPIPKAADTVGNRYQGSASRETKSLRHEIGHIFGLQEYYDGCGCGLGSCPNYDNKKCMMWQDSSITDAIWCPKCQDRFKWGAKRHGW